MKKEEVCALIKTIGIIPAIRVSSGDDAHFAAEAVTHGGIPIVEITMTVPGAEPARCAIPRPRANAWTPAQPS
jgi:2-keto-3-deoxy-6-phosphogluconate aldolase